MARKIIQIAFEPETRESPEDNSMYIASSLYALCDDGTIWLYSPRDEQWYQCALPEIPSDDIEGTQDPAG